MSLLSGKKILLLGFVVVLLVIIPLTVYLVQQQQKLKVGAEKASTLSFTPTSAAISKSTDSPSFDVWLDPSTNQVSFVKLSISYESTKLSVNTFTPNSDAFPTVLQAPDKGTGKATVTLSVGSSADKIIKTRTKVATISFNVLQTATAGQTTISFDPDPATQVLSIASADQFNENVLLNSTPATITIAQAAVGGTQPSGNQVPVCTALNADKQTTGTVPYPVTLTAIGSDPDGTISKVTFNFGDGPTQDITTGGGIGTNSVNLPNPHTYNNAGAFVATAIFTDNLGGVSVVGACTKTFNLTAASGTSTGAGTSTGGTSGGSGGSGTSGGGAAGGTGTSQVAVVASPTPAPIPQLTPLPGSTTKGGLPSAGPGDKIVSFGGLGIVSIIIGALLLFGL